MSWSKEQVYAFVDERPRVGRLATVDADGTPHVVPVWVKRDGESFLVSTMAATRKAQDVMATGKFALAFDKDDLPYMGVSFTGTATAVTDDDPVALVKELAVTYVGPEGGPAFGEYIASVPGERVVLVLTPTEHESWDFSG